MHGAWGALTILIKRQEAAKFRKTIRAKSKHRKESYLPDASDNEDAFDFPEVSEAEMERIKDQIRKKLKRERKIQWIFSSVIFITILFIVYFTFL
jgi:hypothetical protein